MVETKSDGSSSSSSSPPLPLWLHINLWKTLSCVVLWGAAALAPSSGPKAAAALGAAAASSSSSSSSSFLTATGATFLACWTSYCLCWLLKSSAYPDARWRHPASKAERAFVWGVLTCYLVAPAAMLFAKNDNCSPGALGAFVFVYSLGNFWHYVSDAHKHTALSVRPGKLVSSGLFSHSRNPNYFGELLTYFTLAGLPAAALRSALPLLPLAASLLLEWVPNMLGKDRSLRRHGAEWERWAARAPFLLPWRNAAEAVKEIVRAGEVAAPEGYGSEVDEHENENEKEEEKKEGEKAESESSPVPTIAAANNSSKAKKRGGGRSARNKGIAAGVGR